MANYTLSSWIKVDKENLDPNLTQQVFTSGNVMIVRYVYEPNLHFPEHSHPQEQVTIVEEGMLEYEIDGEKLKLGVGDILSIRPNVPHSTVVGADRSVALSIFTPVREEIIIEK